MNPPIEITQIDLRYENHRLKSAVQERTLLASIAERGIDQPLQGVASSESASGRVILLDGFKRLRCARKIKLGQVPFVSIAPDVVSAILVLLKISNAKSLSLLEQARLVDELKRTGGLGVAEIASRLERSKAWVIARLDVLSKMSPKVATSVFSGSFPTYSYLYTLRQFRRLTHAKQSEEEDFVAAVSGRDLSTRDIETLARGFFQGGSQVRAQIQSGNLAWSLGELRKNEREVEAGAESFTELERGVLRDLDIAIRAVGRLTLRLGNPALKTPGFFAEAGLLASGLLRRLQPLGEEIRHFCDRSRQT